MGKHSNRPGHQAGHRRCTVAALIMRDEHPTIPMTIVLDTPPTNAIDPWGDWVNPDAWAHRHFGLAVTA